VLTEPECIKLNKALEETMVGHLGIKVVPTEDADTVTALMPINNKTKQYFGILHGGASLALAETLAGVGSVCHVGIDKKICGTNVTANHVHMSPTEGNVKAVASPIHIGKSMHVWNVDISAEDGTLISTARVTNIILD
jgi:hypothetical protein